jgi:hypothetical protein
MIIQVLIKQSIRNGLHIVLAAVGERPTDWNEASRGTEVLMNFML